jgi:hypothetical protein
MHPTRSVERQILRLVSLKHFTNGRVTWGRWEDKGRRYNDFKNKIIL